MNIRYFLFLFIFFSKQIDGNSMCTVEGVSKLLTEKKKKNVPKQTTDIR